MKIVRDERTQAINEVIFAETETNSQKELMSELTKIEIARYHAMEFNAEKSAEANMHNSDNQKEAQLDYNKYQSEIAKDYNRRQQQMQYMYQFPGVAQIPDFN